MTGNGRDIEEAPADGERRFLATFEQAAVGLAHVGLDGRWLAVNGRLREILGAGRDELIGRSARDITHPDDLDADRELAGQLLAGDRAHYSIEKRYVREDGSIVRVNQAVSLVRAAGDAPGYFIGVIEDITERKRVEEEWRRAEERSRLATEATGVGIFDLDPGSGLVVASDHARAAFGLAPGEELTYEKFLATIPAEDRDRVDRLNKFALDLASGGAYHTEYRAVGLRDGIERWIEARGRATFDEAGRSVRLIGTVLDISERKRAEERARHEQEWLSVTLASIGDAVIATDGRGRVKFMNPVAEALTGWTQGEAVGEPLPRVFQILNEQTRQPAEHPVEKVFREGAVVGLANHTVLVARDGSETPIEDSAAPIRDVRGEIVGAVMVFHDASEQRRHEAQLRASEERHRTILESITDAFFGVDRDWRFNHVNRHAERLIDRESGDLLGKNFWEEFPGVEGSQFERVHLRAMDERVAGSVTSYYPDHDRWYEVHSYPATDGVSMFFRDVTGQKRQEVALRESEERFRQMADSIPQLAWMANSDGHIFYYNHRWYEYTGTTPDQMEGWGWQSVHDPAALPGVLERWGESIASGEPFDMVFPLRGSDGAFRPFLTRVLPLKDERGRVARWFGTNTDIAERREMEAALLAAKEEAEQANKAKDQFLAVLSHELRTPLNPILLSVSSMLERPVSPEEISPILEMIRQNVNLQARLIDDLLDVMRIVRGKIPLRRGVSDCHDLIRRVVEICRGEIQGDGHPLGLDLSAGRHFVDADPARLQQVLWNLLKNAIKFTPEGGAIAVRTRNRGDDILIEVSDTGIGIDPEVIPHIFDPFRQAETSVTRRYGGLGLGLAIGKGIVEAHGGTLAAESPGPDRGATFTMTLAALPGPRPETGQGDGTTAAPPKRPPLKILLVEDDPTTLRVLAKLLRSLGHRVSTADTLESGLEVARGGDYDLIISDIGLPDGSGLDLLRQVIAQRGPVPAIALTGFGTEEDIQRSREVGFKAHMTKPIDFPKLEVVIRQVADGDP